MASQQKAAPIMQFLPLGVTEHGASPASKEPEVAHRRSSSSSSASSSSLASISSKDSAAPKRFLRLTDGMGDWSDIPAVVEE